MAVLQVSQIQIRKGLLQDLGQLASGELGWAVDQLRLFIGNGTVLDGAPYEGNTELLTSSSDIFSLIGNYRYKGLLGGYEVNTGYSRQYQEKIDDFVNVRDFGALGDGFTDDTTAIQRAIDEVYGRRSSITPIQTRRTIYFHPGRYKTTAPLLLPPYTSFKNSGKDSVVIELTSNSANCVVRTSEATGNFSVLGPLSALGPVEISGITFTTVFPNIPLAIIDSAKDVSFYRCKFLGSTSNDKPVVTNPSRGVLINSTGNTARSIFFSECDFSRSAISAEIINTLGTSDVKFDRCTFSNSYQGVSVSGAVASTVDVKVTNSVFNVIAQEAIVSTNTCHGVTSAFNTMLNVGRNYQLGNSPVSSVIKFGGNVSYSIADIHGHIDSQTVAYQAISFEQGTGISLDSQGTLKFGNTFTSIGKSVIFNDHTTINIPLPTNRKNGIIDYYLERGNNNRVGTLHFVLNTAQQKAAFQEKYTENDSVGVEIDIIYNSSLPYIRCTADNSGDASSFTYDIKSLQQ